MANNYNPKYLFERAIEQFICTHEGNYDSQVIGQWIQEGGRGVGYIKRKSRTSQHANVIYILCIFLFLFYLFFVENFVT